MPSMYSVHLRRPTQGHVLGLSKRRSHWHPPSRFLKRVSLSHEPSANYPTPLSGLSTSPMDIHPLALMSHARCAAPAHTYELRASLRCSQAASQFAQGSEWHGVIALHLVDALQGRLQYRVGHELLVAPLSALLLEVCERLLLPSEGVAVLQDRRRLHATAGTREKERTPSTRQGWNGMVAPPPQSA